MRGVFKVIYNIIRGLVRFAFRICVALTCILIKVVTFEPGSKEEITVRKAKRIRALSRFKMFALNSLPDPVNRFLGLYNYKNYLNEHLRDGLQLRYE